MSCAVFIFHIVDCENEMSVFPFSFEHGHRAVRACESENWITAFSFLLLNVIVELHFQVYIIIVI